MAGFTDQPTARCWMPPRAAVNFCCPAAVRVRLPGVTTRGRELRLKILEATVLLRPPLTATAWMV